MASLEQRNGSFRIVFRFRGQKFSQSLATNDESAAITMKASLEQRIKLIKTKMLQPPADGADVAEYLLHGNSLPNGKPKVTVPKSIKFDALCDKFFEGFLRSSIEESSYEMLQTHKRNLIRHLVKTVVISINHGTAQKYINKRSKEPGIRGGNVAAVTIKKEITTLKSILRWAKEEGLIETVFASKGLRYPKGKEKPPFQTLAEIQQKILQNNLSKAEQEELWDCLFLSTDEIATLLNHVNANAAYSFLYPMFAFAAYTGARRSEMIRSQLDDIDLKAKRITIREKKRVRGKSSTRRVPMSNNLHRILKDWLRDHPGGQFTFCFEQVDFGSKERFDGQPIEPDEAHKKFKSTLRGSEWQHVRGWHCLRHSFCSNCAAAGVEQRVINSWVGHQTEEMVLRYRHLFPHREQEAIEAVFK